MVGNLDISGPGCSNKNICCTDYYVFEHDFHSFLLTLCPVTENLNH